MNWLSRVLLTLSLAVPSSAVGISHDLPSSAHNTDDDRLDLRDEDYAYAAKTPATRVAAFLKIAGKKIESAKRLQKSNPVASLREPLKGYLAALQGANLGVSWGTSLGLDMRQQSATIAMTIKRHAEILERLSHEANAEERAVLRRLHEVLTTQESQPLPEKLLR